MTTDKIMEGGSATPQKAFEKMVNKAAWLLSEGRVVKISPYLYYVIGKNSKHLVRYENGRFICTCKGFEEKGVCSHVIAVATLSELKDVNAFLDERVKERVRRELRELYGKK
ncbi:SWIM zinc finger family protein [Thermofilum pendens]|nr:SWIM zinc finger family protein [Thermofilum pendens]